MIAAYMVDVEYLFGQFLACAGIILGLGIVCAIMDSYRNRPKK